MYKGYENYTQNNTQKKYYSIAEKNDYSIYFRPLTVIF